MNQIINSKKIIWSTFIKMAILLVIASVVGTSMLIGVFSIPTGRIEKHVEESVSQLVVEGDHFSAFPGTSCTKQDNYSDAEYINGAMVNNSAKGIFTGLYGLEYQNSLIEITKDSPVTVLENVFNEERQLEYKEYGVRFWNGYEVILKPLLLFLTYGQIRHLNFYLEFGIIISIILLLHRKHLSKYSIPIIISFMLLEPFPLAATMAFAGFFYCTYIPCLLMLLFNDAIQKRNLYPLFFMLIGICVIYFNMNYFQLISFAYALVFYFILNGFPKTIKKSLCVFTISFACWFLGYFGMMAMKWIMYEVLTGNALIPDMISRILYRISATAYYTGPHISRIVALLRNAHYLVSNGPWMIMEIVFITYMLLKTRKDITAKKLKENIFRLHKSLIMIFMLMTFIVVARYLLFANHVYVHAWVMYRLFDAMVLTFNTIITKIAFEGDSQNEKICKNNET